MTQPNKNLLVSFATPSGERFVITLENADYAPQGILEVFSENRSQGVFDYLFGNGELDRSNPWLVAVAFCRAVCHKNDALACCLCGETDTARIHELFPMETRPDRDSTHVIKMNVDKQPDPARIRVRFPSLSAATFHMTQRGQEWAVATC